jgi:hypothetical protein
VGVGGVEGGEQSPVVWSEYINLFEENSFLSFLGILDQAMSELFDVPSYL